MCPGVPVRPVCPVCVPGVFESRVSIAVSFSGTEIRKGSARYLVVTNSHVAKRTAHLQRRQSLAHSMTSSVLEDDADYYDRNRGPIEQLLSEAVSEVMREEPTDPFQYLANYLARRALEERQRRERQRSVICVSDIHGRCKELIALWKALMKELGSEKLADTPVVFLGECVLAISSRIPRREA